MKVDVSNRLDVDTLVSLLQWQATERPQQLAYTFLLDGEQQEVSLTFGQLAQQAFAIATDLQARGLTGARALLLYPPGLDFICGFLGCLCAGVVAIPAYPPRPNQSLSRLQSIISDSQAAIALTTSSLLTTIEQRLAQQSALASFPVLATDTLVPEQAPRWIAPAIEPETLAFLQYTSGSTGQPKGVMVSHENLLCNLNDLDRGWLHTPESVLVSWLPTFHDMGLIYGVLQPLYKGFSCYLMAPVYFLQRPLRWLQAISHYRATHSGAPNFAYDLCTRTITPQQRDTLDLSSWRMALNGAEVVRADVLQRFAAVFEPCGFKGSTFCPGYGLAEATLKVTAVRSPDSPLFYPVRADALEEHRVIEAAEGEPESRILVGCGRTEIDTQIVIVDPNTLTRCQRDRVGEIWVAGSTVAQGYWGKPQETEASFRAYLADTGEGPFLRTGDLGFLKAGELFVTGRIKEVIIIRGRNYYPQDLEATVQQSHSALRPDAGAAFGIEVDGEERLAIVQEVERTYLRKLNVEEVIAGITQVLMAQYELPVYAAVLIKTGSLPKTSSGKIQRQACRAMFQNQTLDVVGQGGSALFRRQLVSLKER